MVNKQTIGFRLCALFPSLAGVPTNPLCKARSAKSPDFAVCIVLKKVYTY
jgi:hypothetical protein